MKNINPSDDTTTLDELIRSVQTQMDSYDAHSDEFIRMAEQLETLYKIKAMPRQNRVSADTVATIAANLAGIALIINYERLHIITTKAFGLIAKTKI